VTKEHLSDIADAAKSITNRVLSLQLATTDERSMPHCSYAPFYRNALGNYYIFVSTLSAHTANLDRGYASILIIEDEGMCRQIYARTRLSFFCKAEEITRDSAKYTIGVKLLLARHGEVISTLAELSDFKLVELVPSDGIFIRGFGQAYKINPSLTEADPITPK
jgi:putative heme iron utilization protein